MRTCHAVTALVVGSAAPALGGCASPAEPASTATIAARSQAVGIAPELVYVTDVDGFELVTQSVGVRGSDGMSAVYARHDGGYATLMLTTSRDADPSGVPCTEPADRLFADVPTSPDAPVERGDLPPHGDGAPLDPVGLGG